MNLELQQVAECDRWRRPQPKGCLVADLGSVFAAVAEEGEEAAGSVAMIWILAPSFPHHAAFLCPFPSVALIFLTVQLLSYFHFC